MTEISSLEPSIALAAYAEPLAANRRVVLFGNALGALPLQLLERGARSVHVCDSDAVRVAEASARNRSTQLSFSSLADSDLALRDAAFELCLIDHLGAFDPVSVLRTAKRAIGARGALLAACPNPEAAFPLLRANHRAAPSLDYYALYDAVAAEFEHVRMLGQTPFVGYAIADFSAAGEPEPVLDTSFVPGGAEEPDWFVALGSAHEVRLEEFAVIQLPTRRLLGAANTGAETRSARESEAKSSGQEIARLNQWIQELESRASTADERADHSETELEELRPQLEAERQAQAALKLQHERQLGELRVELAAQRSEAGTARAELDARRAELDRLRPELDRLRPELETRRTELERLRAELGAKAGQLTELQAQLARSMAELARRDEQLAAETAKLEQANLRELAEFEQQLVERGAQIRRLEQDLRTAERTGRELVRELERRRSESSSTAGAELERALAEREADLQAAAWTIESLSLRLELAAKPRGNEAEAPLGEHSSEEAR